jgi:hypothetical protein
LVDTPGYHRESHIYYQPPADLAVPAVPTRPSQADLEQAVALVRDELLGDFPFAGPADVAHAVALFLLPYVRNMLPEGTPLHLISAPVQGTGKTFLAEMTLLPVFNRQVPLLSWPDSDAELERKVLAVLDSMPPAVVFDNLPIGEMIESPALAAMLTSNSYEGRRIKSSEVIRVESMPVWVATGNNTTLDADLNSRAVVIRLVAPGERTFKNPDLRAWVRQNRGKLIGAALTIVQSWIAAGKPDPTGSTGRYASWGRTIGGILQHAGIGGLLANEDEKQAHADPELVMWEEVFRQGYEWFDDGEFRANELHHALQSEAKIDHELTLRGFSMKLRDLRDVTYGGLRLVHAGKRGGTNLWRLTPLS